MLWHFAKEGAQKTLWLMTYQLTNKPVDRILCTENPSAEHHMCRNSKSDILSDEESHYKTLQ